MSAATTPHVLAVVPARGGSKGMPRKNLLPLDGHPLIAYSIAAACEARLVTRVIVSTDDREIADVSRRYGAEVPFVRPAELAADDTPDLPVFLHALDWLAARDGYVPDLVVHLRPTSPLRRGEDVDRAVALLRDTPAADSVRTVCEPFQNPYKMWKRDTEGWLRPLLADAGPDAFNRPRQTLPAVLWQTAYIDVTRPATLRDQRSMTGRRILPLVTDSDHWVDIDSPAMLDFAAMMLAAGRTAVARPRISRMATPTDGHG